MFLYIRIHRRSWLSSIVNLLAFRIWWLLCAMQLNWVLVYLTYPLLFLFLSLSISIYLSIFHWCLCPVMLRITFTNTHTHISMDGKNVQRVRICGQAASYIHTNVHNLRLYSCGCIESSVIKTFALAKVFVLQEYKLAVIFIKSESEMKFFITWIYMYI